MKTHQGTEVKSLNCKVTGLRCIILQDATCGGLHHNYHGPRFETEEEMSWLTNHKTLTVLPMFNVDKKQEGKQKA